MAEDRLDFRKRHVDKPLVRGRFAFSATSQPLLMPADRMSISHVHELGDEAAAGNGSLSTTRHGHSISFSGGVEELEREPIALFLLRSSGSSSGSGMLPGLRDSRLPLHVSSNRKSHSVVGICHASIL